MEKPKPGSPDYEQQYHQYAGQLRSSLKVLGCAFISLILAGCAAEQPDFFPSPKATLLGEIPKGFVRVHDPKTGETADYSVNLVNAHPELFGEGGLQIIGTGSDIVTPSAPRPTADSYIPQQNNQAIDSSALPTTMPNSITKPFPTQKPADQIPNPTTLPQTKEFPYHSQPFFFPPSGISIDWTSTFSGCNQEFQIKLQNFAATILGLDQIDQPQDFFSKPDQVNSMFTNAGDFCFRKTEKLAEGVAGSPADNIYMDGKHTYFCFAGHNTVAHTQKPIKPQVFLGNQGVNPSRLHALLAQVCEKPGRTPDIVVVSDLLYDRFCAAYSQASGKPGEKLKAAIQQNNDPNLQNQGMTTGTLVEILGFTNITSSDPRAVVKVEDHLLGKDQVQSIKNNINTIPLQFLVSSYTLGDYYRK